MKTYHKSSELKKKTKKGGVHTSGTYDHYALTYTHTHKQTLRHEPSYKQLQVNMVILNCNYFSEAMFFFCFFFKIYIPYFFRNHIGDAIVSVIDIGEIVDHHCLNFSCLFC